VHKLLQAAPLQQLRLLLLPLLLLLLVVMISQKAALTMQPCSQLHQICNRQQR
jgi:hypothetical protein